MEETASRQVREGETTSTSRRWVPAVRLSVALLPLMLGGAVKAEDVVEVVITDALGNIRVITDDQGNVLERHDYLPFGEECTTGPCGSNPGVGSGQPRKFTGKERDAETGLDYFGARYYGSTIGRFTTVDPFLDQREALVDPQRWNRYSYGLNNPFRYVDPDGRNPIIFQRAMEIGQRIWNSPAGQQARQFVATQSANAWMAGMRLINSPAAQEAVQAGAEIVSGADLPGGIPGNLPFKSGDIITREFKTAKGMVELAAEAVVEGKQLHLKDIAVFPKAAGKLNVGAGEVRAMRQQLAEEARGLGFEQLRITGTRVSGAKPGKAVDVTMDLKDRQ